MFQKEKSKDQVEELKRKIDFLTKELEQVKTEKPEEPEKG